MCEQCVDAGPADSQWRAVLQTQHGVAIGQWLQFRDLVDANDREMMDTNELRPVQFRRKSVQQPIQDGGGQGTAPRQRFGPVPNALAGGDQDRVSAIASGDQPQEPAGLVAGQRFEAQLVNDQQCRGQARALMQVQRGGWIVRRTPPRHRPG